MKENVLVRVCLSVVPLLLFVVVWQWFSGSEPSRAFFFATPSSVLATLARNLMDGTLLRHAAVTAGEALLGFLSGNAVGACIGLLLWVRPGTARVAKPYLVVLGAVPVFAIAPMTIIWFGVGFGAKVALAFLATVFVAAAQAYRGAEQVDPLLMQRLHIFGATRWRQFTKLVIPASLIWVLAGLRLTSGLALLGAFIGEFIAADKGLGYYILRAGSVYDTPAVLAGVIVIVSIALAMDRGVDFVEKRAIRW